MQVCAVTEESAAIERRGLKTDEKGRQLLCSFLRKGDVVAMEVCGYANTLARILTKQVGCEVHLLNPGGLAMVWKSRKKTDKEDALKIAKYLRDTPAEEWVEVPLLSEEEEGFRADITMKEFLKKERGMAINRLHALYGNEGITDVTKADLKDDEGRKARHGELSGRSQGYAQMLEEQLKLVEEQLEVMEEVVAEKTRKHELTPYVMSIPGVGIGIAAVLLAYLGDGKRFSKAGEVANYAGFAPRVDCSGDTNHYGSIAKYSYCHPIRGMVLEGVWSISRCSYGGPLREKFQSLAGRMNKRKSAVAVARKLVTLAWLLMRRREYYNGIDPDTLKKKLKFYKVRGRDGGLLPDLTVRAPMVRENQKKSIFS
ncbi:IS110 family transposase [Spirochaetia bacterium]|nr:IS110 family transposase [Spirochaetia bacterium]